MGNLSANRRTKDVTNKAKKERRAGLIPGVIYGKEVGNAMFEISEIELNREIAKHGELAVLDIDLEGKAYKALLKEVQRDPVKKNIIHIDLAELQENQIVQAEIPIVFSGEKMVMKKGGAVQKEKSNVKVECKSNNIPKCVNVDLSTLNIGDVYKISNIEVAEEIAIIEDLNTVIASVMGNKKPSDIPMKEEA